MLSTFQSRKTAGKVMKHHLSSSSAVSTPRCANSAVGLALLNHLPCHGIEALLVVSTALLGVRLW